MRDRLAKFVSAAATRSAVGAIFAALGAVLVLAATYGVCFATAWFITSWWITIPTWGLHAMAVGMVGVLFAGNHTMSREYLESLKVTAGTASGDVVNFYLPGVGMASTVNPLAPDSAHSYLKILLSALFVGPRMTAAAIRMARRSRRLRSIDLDGVEGVIALLLERDGRVPFTELPPRNLPALLPMLAELVGVLFLKAEPPGLSLTTEFRRELAG